MASHVVTKFVISKEFGGPVVHVVFGEGLLVGNHSEHVFLFHFEGLGDLVEGTGEALGVLAAIAMADAVAGGAEKGYLAYGTSLVTMRSFSGHVHGLGVEAADFVPISVLLEKEAGAAIAVVALLLAVSSCSHIAVGAAVLGVLVAAVATTSIGEGDLAIAAWLAVDPVLGPAAGVRG